jgi:UDP-glucose 4-epimerase
VAVYDNLSTGQERFLEQASYHPSFQFHHADLFDRAALLEAMRGQDVVFHLAASADVRFGTLHPARDLEQNTIATHHVLEAMRLCGVARIAFSSTSSVYGEASVFPTPEDCPFPIQTSLYGAAKLASESFISAYAEGFGLQATIFRLVSILGERYSHGHVFDFLEKLKQDSTRIEVLGNGKQTKSYLYVQDCIEAMLLAVTCAHDRISIYNIGTDEYSTVDDSLDWICGELGVNPERVYANGTRGWIGDNPFIFLDCSRIRALGWRPTLSIREGILRTVRYLLSASWLIEART